MHPLEAAIGNQFKAAMADNWTIQANRQGGTVFFASFKDVLRIRQTRNNYVKHPTPIRLSVQPLAKK
jgi:hypothetical protein